VQLENNKELAQSTTILSMASVLTGVTPSEKSGATQASQRNENGITKL